PRNETLKRGAHSLGINDQQSRYQQVFSIAAANEVEALFRDDILPRVNTELTEYWRELLPQMKQLDELGAFQLHEIRSSLPDELLMYADKLSMAHGLEARVPYLDRTVIDFAASVPAERKVR